MSLKSFHVFFIVVALALLAFTGYWSGQRILAGENSASLAMAAVSVLGLGAGLPYLAWFLKKFRSLR